MKLRLLYFGCLILLLHSCSRSSMKEYHEIDSLIVSNMYDKAYHALSLIDRSALNEEKLAYQNLLELIVSRKVHVSISSDSLITFSENYYSKTKDKELLARTQFYKGQLYLDNGRYEDYVLYMKKAEETSSDTHDYETRIKILCNLSNINKENIKLSLDYVDKALHIADSVNDKRWIGFCYNHKSAIYDIHHNSDSSSYYTRKAIPYILFQPKDEQPYHLNNLATEFALTAEMDSAIYYFNKSLSIAPREETYGKLAGVYTNNGKPEEAEKLWEKALKAKTLSQRMIFARWYAKWLRNNKQYEKASLYCDTIGCIYDSITLDKTSSEIMEIQKLYDQEVAERKHQAFVNRLLWVIALMVIIVIGIMAISRYKTLKTKKQLAESNALAAEYSAQIERLKASGKEQTKEAKELQGKLEKLRAEQNEILYRGKQLYDHLMKEGGNAATWHKADFTDFVEYYRTIDMPFVVHLENDYQKLSPSNMTILIFQHLGYTDQQILYLMGMTDGALRTTKSRIKGRRKEE